jgi:Electron transfer DM13
MTFLRCVVAGISTFFTLAKAQDSGISLGSLRLIEHQVAGDVYLLSKKVLEIRGFTFDGAAPATFFWLDKSPTPSAAGGVVAPDGSPTSGCAKSSAGTPLPLAQGVNQRVEFPEGLTIDDFLGGSLSVWCVEFSANLGDLVFPDTLPDGIPAPGPDFECSK